MEKIVMILKLDDGQAVSRDVTLKELGINTELSDDTFQMMYGCSKHDRCSLEDLVQDAMHEGEFYKVEWRPR